jgi:hypothetical protein
MKLGLETVSLIVVINGTHTTGLVMGTILNSVFHTGAYPGMKMDLEQGIINSAAGLFLSSFVIGIFQIIIVDGTVQCQITTIGKSFDEG